jgi:ubiquinone biosynthesis protein Coq4
VRRAIFEAYCRGRRADWLVGADWEHLLDQQLATARVRFGVVLSTYYDAALVAIRSARSLAGPEKAAA